MLNDIFLSLNTKPPIMPSGANPPKGIIFSGVALLAALIAYFLLVDPGTIRPHDFITIFALGVIGGVFVSRLGAWLKEGKKE